MANYVETTDVHATSGNALTIPGEDNNVLVDAGVTLSSDSGYAIYSQGSYSLIAHGTLSSNGARTVQIGTGQSVSKILVASDGMISGELALIVAGESQLANYGSIIGSSDGVELGSGIPAPTTSGANYGLIQGGTGRALVLVNTHFGNAGVIRGTVQIDGGTFDSSTGQVYGMIIAGGSTGTPTTIVAGTNGGTIVGKDENDILIANQSQTAADNAAQFILDGSNPSVAQANLSGGTNALYGGGAFNTFDAGDLLGGTNQVWGGASKMAAVAGYANNTIDFSETPAGRSVYVDLLNGHNAYINAAADNSGVYTFEDSIRNVPNVVGSAGADIILADNGTDRITGGGGADQLFAGAGADTFVYAAYADSRLAHHDTIAGFKTGTDKLDLSALQSSAGHLVIASGTTSTALYLEQTAGTFNASTDLAISFKGAHAIAAGDVIV